MTANKILRRARLSQEDKMKLNVSGPSIANGVEHNGTFAEFLFLEPSVLSVENIIIKDPGFKRQHGDRFCVVIGGHSYFEPMWQDEPVDKSCRVFYIDLADLPHTGNYNGTDINFEVDNEQKETTTIFMFLERDPSYNASYEITYA